MGLPLGLALGLLFPIRQAVTFLDIGLGLGSLGACAADLPVHCCLQLP